MAIDKNKIIEAATKYVQKGQYDKAIKEYNKLLEVDPKDVRILQKLGELHQKKGENDQAAECFLKVAESYSADGFFLKAVAVYKQVLKLNPSLIDVNLKLAELHQQLGLMSDAMAQYQLVASHYERSGDTRASLDTLRKMVEIDPDNIASRIKLAELYAREQMNEEAIDEFRRCADYLKSNNRVDDYLKVAERLVFLDPSDLSLTRELANIYLTKQDTKRALAKLQLCFKADPKDIETLNLLALAFKDVGQTAKTVSIYKELAKIYDEQDKIDEEQDIWRKIAAIAPDDPDARGKLAPKQAEAPASQRSTQPAPVASTSQTFGRPASPRFTAEQIAKLLTETDVYVKYGLHDKALEHLKRLFAADPDNIDGHEKAIALYEATSNNAAGMEALVKVIRACIAKGDGDRARRHLQTLCEKDPMHPEVQGFLEAVGSLASEEEVAEVAEIEDEAILVDASDEVEELVEAPIGDSRAEGGADGSPAPAIAEGDEEGAAPGEPDAVEDEGLLVEPPQDSDALALAAASDADESLVDEPDLAEEELELDASAQVEEPLPELDADAVDLYQEAEAEPELAPEEPDAQAASDGIFAEPSSQATSPHLEAFSPRDVRPTNEFPAFSSRSVPEREEDEAEREEARLPGAASETDEAHEVRTAEQEVPEVEEPGSEELNEAAFFIEQGVLEEAREILDTVALAYPESRRASELRVLLEAKEAAAASAGEGSSPAGFDLIAEFANEGLTGGKEEEFQYSVEDVFDEFKRGIQRVVKPEDVDTHYDLGIAYKEMGLLDDAVGEFEQALKGAEGKKKEIEIHTMIGMCLSEKGQYEGAVASFKRGLASAHVTPEAAKALHFEIAQSWERSGGTREALSHYIEVERIDPRFRDVKAVAIALRQRLAEGAAPGGALGEESDESTELASPLSRAKPSSPNGLSSARTEAAGAQEDAREPGKPGKGRKVGFV